MRRLAVLAALAGLACTSELRQVESGPTDAFFFPMGLGVLDHDLVVASSNADLTYDSETGGSVIAVDPLADPATREGALNIQSFAGELGVARAADCPALALAEKAVVVPVRGANLVYRIDVGTDGALSCDGCEIPVGSAERGDPFSVGVACGPGIARAYVGYLRSTLGLSWFTQIDLTKGPGEEGYVRHRQLNESGQIRGWAYDAARERLYLTRTATGAQTTLRWIDLSGDCLVDEADVAAGGCRTNISFRGDVPAGLELRGIALATEASAAGAVRRAYLTARIYDATAAASAGVRIGDYDGLLLVADLFEDLTGRLRLSIVEQIPIGYGAGDVRVLPAVSARAGQRDVVVALATEDGVLWVYDDETGARAAIGRSAETGIPLVGRGPFGLAVDPDPLAGNVARVYVGSFRESFVTPIDVPLEDPEAAAPVEAAPGNIRRIGPGVAP